MLDKLKVVFQALKVLAALIPLIRPLIETFEVPGNGAEKKAAVLDAITAIINALPWPIEDSVKEMVLTIVGGMIDLIVGILNLIGRDWGGTT